MKTIIEIGTEGFGNPKEEPKQDNRIDSSLDADGSTTHALTFTKGILTACVTI